MAHRIIRETVSEGGKKAREREKRNAQEITYPERIAFSLLLPLLLRGGRGTVHAYSTHLEGEENSMSFGA
jgi:hypothetical protein